MKIVFLSALLVATTFSSTSIAKTTFGVGIGSLYNGLGLNFGRVNDNSLIFGSLGCISASSSRSRDTAGDIVTSDRDYETNCGMGLGYIDMSLLPGNNHGLGLSLGYTYDTKDISGGAKFHLMPGYHYFFDGTSQRGFNLGFGARLTRSDESSRDTDLFFNLGYQF